MRFAQKEGKRIFPNPLEKDAVCPLCKAPVIGKCGKIKIWHWAHKSNKECDPWADGETDWHLNWKGEFPQEMQEVIIGKHRADIKMNGIVLEFQKSPLSSEQINEREEFYDKMVWIFPEEFSDNLSFRFKKDFVTFRWKWPKKSWEISTKPKYIDLGIINLGDGLLQHKLLLIKKINWGGYVGGWGKLVTKEVFIEGVEHGYYGY